MNQTDTNVDQSEIRKFEALAARWWDPESEFKTLHQINPLRLDYIDRLSGGLAGKEVLDVGTGGGILAESMVRRGAKVMGIDMAEAPLRVAELHQLESGVEVEYRKVAVEELAALRPESFDVVTCLEMLEHVPDPSSVVAACARLVRPGGRVFFSTLNRNPKSYLFAIIGAEYLLQLLPKGTHDYAKFICPAELEHWIRAAGLTANQMIGLHYNPFSKSYRLGPGVDVNYMVACER